MRYSVRKAQNRYIRLPFLWLTPPTEGLPWDDLRKILPGCQQMASVPNGVETLPKISIAWVGCTNVTDRQTTDDRRTADDIANVNVSSRSLKSNAVGVFRAQGTCLFGGCKCFLHAWRWEANNTSLRDHFAAKRKVKEGKGRKRWEKIPREINFLLRPRVVA